MILENNWKFFQELQSRIIGKNFEHYCLKPNDMHTVTAAIIIIILCAEHMTNLDWHTVVSKY